MDEKKIDVKIVSKLEAYWTKIYENCKMTADNIENDLLLNKEIMILAKRKIEEAKRQNQK